MDQTGDLLRSGDMIVKGAIVKEWKIGKIERLVASLEHRKIDPSALVT